MPSVRIKRGTRAALDALSAASGLKSGEQYLILDEARVAVATSVNSYQAMAKQGEGGGGSATATTVTIPAPQPYNAKTIDIALAGASVGQKVMVSVSLDMPAGEFEDELEMDPITVAGRVLSAGNVRVILSSPGIIAGPRNINLMVI